MTDVRVIPFLVSELRLPPHEQELLSRKWWPSYAHAVVHPEGIFLFDNGAGLGNAEIEDALAEHGISLADATGAANCHLHFDHSGQNARLPKGLPIFVQRREWAKVHEPDYTVAAWIDVPGLTYEVVDGETEVAPGLRVIPTPGHTSGHQSLAIQGSDGTVVLVGQALQSRLEWEGHGARGLWRLDRQGSRVPAVGGAVAIARPGPRSLRARPFDLGTLGRPPRVARAASVRVGCPP